MAIRLPNSQSRLRRGDGRGVRRVVGAAFAALALAAIPAAGSMALEYGISFTFDRIDPTLAPDCPRHLHATVVGKSFLMTYFDPGERSRITDMLRTMRRSGFSDMEVLVGFTDRKKHHPRLFSIDTDGPRLAAALRAYAADVRAAGFSHLLVVLVPQGPLSPSCKASPRQSWGECFDPTTVPSSLAFVKHLRAGLGNASRLIFDVAPQMCIVPRQSALVRSNLQKYLPAMVAAYTKAFPRDLTGVSCSLERFAAGRRSIDAAYAAAGGRPGFYAITVYPSTHPSANLPAAAQALGTVDIPVIVSEISYADPPLLTATIGALGTAAGGLKAVYFWPLIHQPSTCSIDVAPPYTLRAATSIAR